MDIELQSKPPEPRPSDDQDQRVPRHDQDSESKNQRGECVEKCENKRGKK